ncbi:MAG: UbiD family decarboxylase [Proteobacteria bacterium]|nr:UbiD family decarboxylase [Pseudomonadota bacterium]
MPRTYNDLRQHLTALEEKGLLFRVKRAINKNTELHPLIRWQFRSNLPESQRKGFLFENVVDSKGRHYDFPVAVGVLASSPQIYAVGLQCPIEAIPEKWERALSHPIAPEMVDQGPVQEVIHLSKDLEREGGGLDMIPVPVSTPGFDNAPYTTCSQWFTKDPESGIRNVGNYRGQIKGRRKIGCYNQPGQHFTLHLRKCKEKGIPFEAALVIGGPPIVSYAAVQKVPYGVDEMAVAGGLAGEPLRMVRCKTVDLEVPAEAELVIEGKVSTEFLEPEGPFGESHGHMHPRELSPFMDVTAITHRKDMIYLSFISQVTPSESSVIKKVGYDLMFLRFLKEDVGIKSVIRVMMHEPLTNLRKVIVIQMKKPSEAEAWRALLAATSFHQGVGKILVTVDEDINPDDMDSVLWAISYRCVPHKDIQIVRGQEKGHAPPFQYFKGLTEHRVEFEEPANDSALLINAILKQPFPPVSLPKREYMENAARIWEELGLPKIERKYPWYGYSLGQWDEELEEEAALAIKGDHYITGEKLAREKIKI